MEKVFKLICVLITCLILYTPSEIFANDIKLTDLVNAQYTLLFSPDRNAFGEGLFLTYEMAEKRTRFGIGFNHTSLESENPESDPIGIGVGVTGAVGGLPVDLDFELDDITYKSRRTGSMFDILLLGEYNYLKKQWNFGDGKDIKKTHGLDFWAGAGAKIDISMEQTEYQLYIDGELFDTLENPLSNSKTSGIKFLVSHGINYRFSMVNIGLHTVVSVPSVKKSFVLLGFGFSL